MQPDDELDYHGLGWDRPNEKPVHPARYDTTPVTEARMHTDMKPAKFDADFRIDLSSDPRDRSFLERIKGE